MSLDLEYFKNQMHINDLQNLNKKELYFIIRLLEDELEEFNCYVHTQFYLALYMCVFILNSFPCGYF